MSSYWLLDYETVHIPAIFAGIFLYKKEYFKSDFFWVG